MLQLGEVEEPQDQEAALAGEVVPTVEVPMVMEVMAMEEDWPSPHGRLFLLFVFLSSLVVVVVAVQ